MINQKNQESGDLSEQELEKCLACTNDEKLRKDLIREREIDQLRVQRKRYDIQRWGTIQRPKALSRFFQTKSSLDITAESGLEAQSLLEKVGSDSEDEF